MWNKGLKQLLTGADVVGRRDKGSFRQQMRLSWDIWDAGAAWKALSTAAPGPIHA